MQPPQKRNRRKSNKQWKIAPPRQVVLYGDAARYLILACYLAAMVGRQIPRMLRLLLRLLRPVAAVLRWQSVRPPAVPASSRPDRLMIASYLLFLVLVLGGCDIYDQVASFQPPTPLPIQTQPQTPRPPIIPINEPVERKLGTDIKCDGGNWFVDWALEIVGGLIAKIVGGLLHGSYQIFAAVINFSRLPLEDPASNTLYLISQSIALGLIPLALLWNGGKLMVGDMAVINYQTISQIIPKTLLAVVLIAPMGGPGLLAWGGSIPFIVAQDLMIYLVRASNQAIGNLVDFAGVFTGTKGCDLLKMLIMALFGIVLAAMQVLLALAFIFKDVVSKIFFAALPFAPVLGLVDEVAHYSSTIYMSYLQAAVASFPLGFIFVFMSFYASSITTLTDPIQITLSMLYAIMCMYFGCKLIVAMTNGAAGQGVRIAKGVTGGVSGAARGRYDAYQTSRPEETSTTKVDAAGNWSNTETRAVRRGGRSEVARTTSDSEGNISQERTSSGRGRSPDTYNAAMQGMAARTGYSQGQLERSSRPTMLHRYEPPTLAIVPDSLPDLDNTQRIPHPISGVVDQTNQIADRNLRPAPPTQLVAAPPTSRLPQATPPTQHFAAPPTSQLPQAAPPTQLLAAPPTNQLPQAASTTAQLAAGGPPLPQVTPSSSTALPSVSLTPTAQIATPSSQLSSITPPLSIMLTAQPAPPTQLVAAPTTSQPAMEPAPAGQPVSPLSAPSQRLVVPLTDQTISMQPAPAFAPQPASTSPVATFATSVSTVLPASATPNQRLVAPLTDQSINTMPPASAIAPQPASTAAINTMPPAPTTILQPAGSSTQPDTQPTAPDRDQP